MRLPVPAPPVGPPPPGAPYAVVRRLPSYGMGVAEGASRRRLACTRSATRALGSSRAHARLLATPACTPRPLPAALHAAPHAQPSRGAAGAHAIGHHGGGGGRAGGRAGGGSGAAPRRARGPLQPSCPCCLRRAHTHRQAPAAPRPLSTEPLPRPRSPARRRAARWRPAWSRCRRPPSLPRCGWWPDHRQTISCNANGGAWEWRLGGWEGGSLGACLGVVRALPSPRCRCCGAARVLPSTAVRRPRASRGAPSKCPPLPPARPRRHPGLRARGRQARRERAAGAGGARGGRGRRAGKVRGGHLGGGACGRAGAQGRPASEAGRWVGAAAGRRPPQPPGRRRACTSSSTTTDSTPAPPLPAPARRTQALEGPYGAAPTKEEEEEGGAAPALAAGVAPPPAGAGAEARLKGLFAPAEVEAAPAMAAAPLVVAAAAAPAVEGGAPAEGGGAERELVDAEERRLSGVQGSRVAVHVSPGGAAAAAGPRGVIPLVSRRTAPGCSVPLRSRPPCSRALLRRSAHPAPPRPASPLHSAWSCQRWGAAPCSCLRWCLRTRWEEGSGWWFAQPAE